MHALESHMKLVISYELTRHKWARAYISDGKNEASMDVWYLSADALGDLLRATIALLSGAEDARIIWENEYGQNRWIIHRHNDLVSVEILHFSVTFSTADDQYGSVIFSTLCPLRKFAVKVRDALRRLLTEIGPDEYARRWGQDFPSAQYAALDRLVRESS